MATVSVAWSVSLSQEAGQSSGSVPPVPVSVMRSAILPGWGEFGLGKAERGRVFTKVDLVLWSALVQTGYAGRQHDSRLKSFGSLHAGVSFSGKDNQFVTDVGNYMSLDDFNEVQQRLRNTDRVYRDSEIYGWAWDSDENRKTYRRYRIQRDTVRKIGQFVIGGMILNRIVSIIDVAYLHRLDRVSSGLILYPLIDVESGHVGLAATVRF